jgi:hypothetical protein
VLPTAGLSKSKALAVIQVGKAESYLKDSPEAKGPAREQPTVVPAAAHVRQTAAASLGRCLLRSASLGASSWAAGLALRYWTGWYCRKRAAGPGLPCPHPPAVPHCHCGFADPLSGRPHPPACPGN